MCKMDSDATPLHRRTLTICLLKSKQEKRLRAGQQRVVPEEHIRRGAFQGGRDKGARPAPSKKGTPGVYQVSH